MNEWWLIPVIAGWGFFCLWIGARGAIERAKQDMNEHVISRRTMDQCITLVYQKGREKGREEAIERVEETHVEMQFDREDIEHHIFMDLDKRDQMSLMLNILSKLDDSDIAYIQSLAGNQSSPDAARKAEAVGSFLRSTSRRQIDLDP